jgi:hypothetical protein
MKRIGRLFSTFCLAAAFTALLGCAHPDLLSKNESYEAVVGKLGTPDSNTLNADGSRRIVYSMQPMGQQVYELVFDKAGRLVSNENILQEKYFSRIRPKFMNEEDIRILLGAPCEEQHYRGLQEYSFMYRYLDGAFPMALWVDFDEKTHEVLRYVISIDPWSQQDTDWEVQ